MPVSYYQLDKSTTSIPSTSSAESYIDGFYGVNGTLEYLIAAVSLRYFFDMEGWNWPRLLNLTI